MTSHQDLAKYPDTLLLIDGQWVPAENGKTIDVFNPATGLAIGQVAHASVGDLNRALTAAERGFIAWREVSAHERAATMRRAARLLRERADSIAANLTQEQGKPLAEARGEVMAGAEILEWFADEGLRVYGRIVPSRNIAVQQLVLKEPVGPVAAFTPWNFPINQVVRKLGAALATGCSCLVKAPEETPSAPAALIAALVDAGVPAGTVGLVFGDPAQISSYLIASPIIRKVTFTGSTPIGKELASLAGRHMKRVTMELGGHAPVIIAEDADIELAARNTIAGKFRNAGQICIAPTRFLVHDRIKDEFAAAFVEKARALQVGNGLDATTTMGPLANARRLVAMEKLVTDACYRGATLALGGERLGGQGNFWAPTVLTNVPQDAEVFNEEPFGPIAAIRTFSHIEEAIAEANRLPFGLASYAYTRSIKTAHQLSRGLEVGMLWVNQSASASAEMPFGGVKDSGYGSEGGPEALESYLNTKSVSIMSI